MSAKLNWRYNIIVKQEINGLGNKLTDKKCHFIILSYLLPFPPAWLLNSHNFTIIWIIEEFILLKLYSTVYEFVENNTDTIMVTLHLDLKDTQVLILVYFMLWPHEFSFFSSTIAKRKSYPRWFIRNIVRTSWWCKWWQCSKSYSIKCDNKSKFSDDSSCPTI